MESEIQWHTERVFGHCLENRLQSLTSEGYEIVSVEKSKDKWLIIAHRSRKNLPSKKPFGFQAV
jgi:hypothetical protein